MPILNFRILYNNNKIIIDNNQIERFKTSIGVIDFRLESLNVIMAVEKLFSISDAIINANASNNELYPISSGSIKKGAMTQTNRFIPALDAVKVIE